MVSIVKQSLLSTLSFFSLQFFSISYSKISKLIGKSIKNCVTFLLNSQSHHKKAYFAQLLT